MEIKAKRGDLLATLYWTQSIVERRNTMPILANVIIEAQKNDIRVTATDLEVGVSGRVDGEVAKEGTVTVNAKKLYEIVREVPNDQVQLKRLENEWVEIRSGKSVFKIFGMEAQRVSPVSPSSIAKDYRQLPASTVREMIERTIFSVSTDETRYSLNGVYIEQSEGTNVRMVATDGHRLAFEEKQVGVLWPSQRRDSTEKRIVGTQEIIGKRRRWGRVVRFQREHGTRQ